MRFIFALIFSAILFSACCRSIPIAENGLMDDGGSPTAQLDLIYQYSKVFPNQTQVSIGLIDDNEVVFYGVKRVKDTLRLVNNSKSVFEIGSITKH